MFTRKTCLYALAATALAGTTAGSGAMAQQSAQYEFAWAMNLQSNAVYVSDSVAPVRTIGDRVELRRRWNSALRRKEIDLEEVSNWPGGTPGGVVYRQELEADIARYRFIDRNGGNTVRVLAW